MGETENDGVRGDDAMAGDIHRVNESLVLATKKLADAEAALVQAEKYRKEMEEARSQVTACLTEAQQIAAQLRALATDALAAKTQVDDHQAVVASKSDHIEQAQVHADKVRSNLDRQLTAGTQQATEAEAQRTRAEAAALSANEHLASAKAALVATETERAVAQSTAEEAQKAMQSVLSLSTNASSIEEKVKGYERELEKLLKSANERVITIDGLLPGATSAGLSSAFDLRRKSFLKPSATWQWAFIGSLVLLVVLALSGLWGVYRAPVPLTYDELFRLWLARLPVAGALIWLALYASRESALAKRLEEDYGYKSAIAASFEGFHKQMSEIVEQVNPESPLAQLCTNTLVTIASPPGRIYDKHNLTVTPSAEVIDAIRAALNMQASDKTT